MKHFRFVIICILVAWLVVAEIVFAVRHPWATDTERLIHIWDALTFKKLPDGGRPREQGGGR
jgi:hypothetical protein